MQMKQIIWSLILLVSLFSPFSFAAEGGGHSDPVTSVILGVTVLLVVAIIGRDVARRFNQPGVLGELLMGVVVGNLCYFAGVQLIVLLREGSSVFDIMKEILAGMPQNQAVAKIIPNPYYASQVSQVLAAPDGNELLKVAYSVDIFSRFGVIFLLFMVGLESSIEELKHTGKESIIVAVIGVIVPMILGFAVAHLLLPKSSYVADLFIAATLSATSIGITARVLTEMKKLQTREARTIMGAAMLDDILGLIILAVVSGVVINGSIDGMMILRIILFSVLFFAGVLWLGPIILPKAISLFKFHEDWEAKLFISFIFIMLLAWLASLVQLATIIGAFAAGVILSDDYFKKSDKRTIQDLVAPLESILAPMFFTLIGMQVKLETFAHWNVIILASGLIIAAIVGKVVSGWGANAKDDRLLIGLGMMPRGEVGLVFASIGRSLGVISDDLFSAVVLMVMVTTFITPPLLKSRYSKMQGRLKA
jgi:Kef-type K+ transport system membrane component KefB